MSQTPKVVRLGSFAGGSFGQPGDPREVYDYFAVDSDVCASHPALVKLAFRHEWQAKQRLAEILRERREEKARLEREEARQQELARIGASLRAILEQHLGHRLSSFRWSDHLIPLDRLTPKCQAEVRRLATTAQFDVLADGDLFRIRRHFAAGVAIVPLTLVE